MSSADFDTAKEGWAIVNMCRETIDEDVEELKEELERQANEEQ